MEMSEELKQFYREYANWLNDGAPEHTSFRRFDGLCICLIRWLSENKKISTITYEMSRQFVNAGLSEDFPFNSADRNDRMNSYSSEVMRHTSYLNKKRRQWVFDHAE